MLSKVVWMNGELVPFERATVHFLTPSLHYGTGLYEGIRAYATADGPGIFRLREHAERLVQSAHLLGLRDLPFDAETVVGAAQAVVVANGFASCYVRPLVFLTHGSWNLNVDGATIALGVAAWEWNAYLGAEARERGVRANVSSFTRHHPNITLTKAKVAGNYVNSVLAKTESVRLGFEEAIMLDPMGFVAECTGENLFLVRKGRIYTPDSATVLEGITRDAMITFARDAGYEVVEQPVSRDQLYAADEVFVCGTAAEVVGLREIDFRTVGDGRCGPVTRHLQEVYARAVRGEEARYRHWVTLAAAPTQVERLAS
jgi:branched-chain amino acid aminotransferase